MDPDSGAPSGFYRSLVGDLALRDRTRSSTRARSAPIRIRPTSSCREPPRCNATAGAGLYATAEAAAEQVGTPPSTLADDTRVRVLSEGDPRHGRDPDPGGQGHRRDRPRLRAGHRPRPARQRGSRGLDAGPEPRVALAQRRQRQRRLRRRGAVLRARRRRPDGEERRRHHGQDHLDDGRHRALRLGPQDLNRLAHRRRRATAGPSAPPTRGGTPRRPRPARSSWTARHRSPRRPPQATTGNDGWLVSPAEVTLTARDASSGVRSISWRLKGGTAATYTAPTAVTKNGTQVFEYRATDKAGIREAWKSVTLRIDTKAPTITVALSGKAGAAAGTWRGPVTVTPTIRDTTSGVAASERQHRRRRRRQADHRHDPSSRATARTPSRISARDAAGNRELGHHRARHRHRRARHRGPRARGDRARRSPPTATGSATRSTLPFSVSEPGTVTAVITDAAATVVRTVTVRLGRRRRVADLGRSHRRAASPLPTGATP